MQVKIYYFSIYKIKGDLSNLKPNLQSYLGFYIINRVKRGFIIGMATEFTFYNIARGGWDN